MNSRPYRHYYEDPDETYSRGSDGSVKGRALRGHHRLSGASLRATVKTPPRLTVPAPAPVAAPAPSPQDAYQRSTTTRSLFLRAAAVAEGRRGGSGISPPPPPPTNRRLSAGMNAAGAPGTPGRTMLSRPSTPSRLTRTAVAATTPPRPIVRSTPDRRALKAGAVVMRSNNLTVEGDDDEDDNNSLSTAEADDKENSSVGSYGRRAVVERYRQEQQARQARQREVSAALAAERVAAHRRAVEAARNKPNLRISSSAANDARDADSTAVAAASADGFNPGGVGTEKQAEPASRTERVSRSEHVSPSSRSELASPSSRSERVSPSSRTELASASEHESPSSRTETAVARMQSDESEEGKSTKEEVSPTSVLAPIDGNVGNQGGYTMSKVSPYFASLCRSTSRSKMSPMRLRPEEDDEDLEHRPVPPSQRSSRPPWRPQTSSSSLVKKVAAPPSAAAQAASASVRRRRRKLMLLQHAAACENTMIGECPEVPHCDALKRLWAHITKCNSTTCDVPACLSSRAVLHHYLRCREGMSCPTCGDLRTAQSRSGGDADVSTEVGEVEELFGEEDFEKDDSEDDDDNQTTTTASAGVRTSARTSNSAREKLLQENSAIMR